MKKLSLITLSLFAAISLEARENPFVSTNAYEEEKARIIEQNAIDAQAAQSEAYIKEMQKMMESIRPDGTLPEKKPVVQEPKKEIVTKDEIKELLKNVEKQNAVKTQQIVKKELEKAKEDQTTKEVVFVKPRTDIQVLDKTIKPLPYVEISYNDNSLSINTNYEMKKSFNLESENKIIVDFEATKKFTTKKNELSSENFKTVVIGNHQEKNFFRVVVKTSNKPSSYKISKENGSVKISN